MASRMRSSIGISRRSSITSGAADGKRSSVGGNVRAVAKDPRPILDKGYIRDGIAYLSTFLRELGYEGACSLKELRQPTTAAVFNIFKFLIKRILPRHDIAKMDEVNQSLMLLGYPCKINKSWLTAVASPHAWPHLLAAIQWLCHAIECMESCDMHEVAFGGSTDEVTMFPGEDEGKPAKQRRQEFHSEFYRSFMDFGEVNVEGSEYKMQCDVKENLLIHAIRDLDGAIEVCQRGIAEASADPSPLQRAEMDAQCFMADKGKFEKLIQQLEEHVQQQSILSQQKQEQMQDEERLFAVLEGERQQLEARVASQPLSSADVQRLTAETEQLSAERRDLRQKLDNLEKETWQAEMDCNKKEKALVDERQKILASGYDLVTHSFAAIQEQLLVDEAAIRSQRLTLQGEKEKLEQMTIKQQEFVSTLENDLKLAKATHKRVLQQLEDEHQREVARSERYRNALHSKLESKGVGHRLADAQDALRQSRARLEQTRLQNKAELDDRENFLRTAMGKVVDHLTSYEQLTQLNV